TVSPSRRSGAAAAHGRRAERSGGGDRGGGHPIRFIRNVVARHRGWGAAARWGGATRWVVDGGPSSVLGGSNDSGGPVRHTFQGDRLLRPFRLCQPHAPRSLGDCRADALRGV